MATPLRLISIHVEEPKAGAFAWRLAEQSDAGEWVEIDRADAPSGTYREAMAAGLLALEKSIDDLDIGPRQQKARSKTPLRSPPRTPPKAPPQAPSAAQAPPPASKPPSGPFGFGSL